MKKYIAIITMMIILISCSSDNGNLGGNDTNKSNTIKKLPQEDCKRLPGQPCP